MARGSRGALSWIGLLFVGLVAAILWIMDTDAVLRSTRPAYAWITVAVMWVEIAALMAVLIRRFRLRRPGLGLAIAIAFGAAAVNAVGAWLLAPAIVLG